MKHFELSQGRAEKLIKAWKQIDEDDSVSLKKEKYYLFVHKFFVQLKKKIQREKK